MAIDGKTLRASMDADTCPLHKVSAWSSGNRMVLGQQVVDRKINEIRTIPALLRVLDLRECIVTVDAMGCQKEIAKAITGRKADYILAVKGNQKRLHQAIQAHYTSLDAAPDQIPHGRCTSEDKGHGRKVVREVTTLDAVRLLPEDLLLAWTKLETLVRVRSTSERDGKVLHEDRFYISTLPAKGVEAIADGVRSYWGIENSLHWALAVAFNEDRNRKGTAPEAGVLLRHIVLNLLRQHTASISSIKDRRMKAALNPAYRLEALMGFKKVNMD